MFRLHPKTGIHIGPHTRALLYVCLLAIGGLVFTGVPHIASAQSAPDTVILPNVTGVVYHDLNGNGTRNPGEPGIPFVTVVLETEAGVVIATAETDATGQYTFNQRTEEADDYFVRVIVPQQYTNTTPVRVAVNLDAPGTQVVDFGLEAIPYVIFMPYITRG